ncbi:hypothetical protein OF83DRAFT_1251546 [Amylostereum chailletii]|nr:hypothetical protein OF83DRAFT_1251546 [Amylostereum chailletii]
MSVSFPPPKRGQAITLAVRFVYSVPKASSTGRVAEEDVTADLSPQKVKKDLDGLALMSPKSSHIIKSTTIPGAVELLYPTKFGSQHAGQVETKSREVDKELMARRAVASIAFYYLPAHATSIGPLFRPVFEVHSSSPRSGPPSTQSLSKARYNALQVEKNLGQKRPAAGSLDDSGSGDPRKKRRLASDSQPPGAPEETDPVTALALKQLLQERDNLAGKVRQLEGQAHEDQQRERMLRDELEELKRNWSGGMEAYALASDVSMRLEFAEEREQEIWRRLERVTGRMPFEHANVYDMLDVVESRVRDLEVRLELEASAHRAAETRLRGQRDWHARALRDIENECREPFVVPALLDAFLSISQMTKQVEMHA